MAQSKGASLDPSTHAKGGAVPDGDYLIKSVSCEMFDYGGNAEAVPAIAVLYADPTNQSITFEQNYSAGKSDRLIPSDDKKRMVHPRGEAASYAGGSNASAWLSSMLKAGFPTERMSGDDVTVFTGSKVTVTNVAQQARPGLKDQKEGKTIPLVSKVLALPGASVVRPTHATRVAAQPAPATAQSTTAAAPAVATPSVNGDVSDVALAAVLQALEVAPDHSLKVKGLAVRCLKFAPGTKLNDLTKTITGEWLAANADAAGWITDMEVVALA